MSRIASSLLLIALVMFLFLASACSNDSTENTNLKTVAYVMPTQQTPSRINSSNASASSRPVATATSDSAPDQDDTIRQNILAAADSKITYEQLKKNADRYNGEPWAFAGRVFQIQEVNGQTTALVSLDAWGNKMVEVDANFTTDFVEKDQVYVVGYLAGNYSYTSVAGWTLTVPQVDARAILKPSEAARLKAGKTTSIKR